MNLPGSIASADSGLLGFDTDTVVTAAVAQQFFQRGYRFCARYLSLHSQQGADDLSSGEASILLNAGLAVVAVQHVLPPGWPPTASLGTEYGTNVAKNANSIGLPPRMNLWCDLEGVLANTPVQNVIDYCQQWHQAVLSAGYIPGLYIGDVILSSQQLYYNLSFQHYWRAEGHVPSVEVKGYQLVQGHSNTHINGIYFGKNATQHDNLGGAVIWLAPQDVT